MTRTIREIGPLAIVTVVVLAVVLWLLGANPDVGRWLLAAVLFAHGWVHLMFVFPVPAAGEKDAPASWPFDLRRAWVVGATGGPTDELTFGLGVPGGTGGSPVVRLLRGLVVVTAGLSTLAAMATVGLLVPGDWWGALTLAAAAASAMLLALAFSPTLVLGFVIDAFLAWLALAGPWRP
jgi:hypothetical protein